MHEFTLYMRSLFYQWATGLPSTVLCPVSLVNKNSLGVGLGQEYKNPRSLCHWHGHILHDVHVYNYAISDGKLSYLDSLLWK